MGNGGGNPMQQTHDLLESNGTMLTNWMTHTPICSPSRSETLSGRYFHNIKSSAAVPPHKVMASGAGHVDGKLYANQSVGVLLRAQRGYNVALFGKANFNTNDGFDRWFEGEQVGYVRSNSPRSNR